MGSLPLFCPSLTYATSTYPANANIIVLNIPFPGIYHTKNESISDEEKSNCIIKLLVRYFHKLYFKCRSMNCFVEHRLQHSFTLIIQFSVINVTLK